MEVLLFNDYKTQRLPEGFDDSVFNDPEFDINTIEHLWVIEEYQNHGVISCKNLKMIVSIDEEEKRQEEESFKKFLAECQNNPFSLASWNSSI